MSEDKAQGRPDEDAAPGAGHRDLDYGHAFGTQRDRSSGNEADYVEDYSESWIDALPDARLERDVREHLREVLGDALNINTLDIIVEESVVTLRGDVEDADVSREAERVVKEVAGVETVINRLQTR